MSARLTGEGSHSQSGRLAFRLTPGSADLIIQPLGWLWHWLRHLGWRIEVFETPPLRVQLWKWVPPPPTTWLTAELPTKQAALGELERLAALIEDGSGPPSIEGTQT